MLIKYEQEWNLIMLYKIKRIFLSTILIAESIMPAIHIKFKLGKTSIMQIEIIF